MARTKDQTSKDNPKKRSHSSSQHTNSNARAFKKAKAKANPNPPSSYSSTSTPLQSHDISNPVSSSALPPKSPNTPTTATNPTSSSSIAPQPLLDLTTHSLHPLSIISSSKISQRVSRVLDLLSIHPTPKDEKERVVVLSAKASVAAKMISIAEIAKREIAREGGKWFSYCAVEEVVKEVQRKPNETGNGGKEREVNGDAVDGKDASGKEAGEEDGQSEDETTAFETMKTPWERANEGKAKVRAVPVMKIYLSRVRIESLRRAYGEQTNALNALQGAK